MLTARPPSGADNAGMTGTLVVDLRYPPSAFLYQATTPVVAIDGVPQPREPWGPRRFTLPAGSYRIDVHVPYALPRKAGRASREVTVPAAGEVRVEYLAPTITFARGSLGVPGEQVSYGASAIKKANIAAVIVVAVLLIAVLIF